MAGRHRSASATPWHHSPAETPRHRREPSRGRRARGLRGTLGLTLLAAAVPGSGLWWSGRRWWGLLALVPLLALGGYVLHTFSDVRSALDFVLDPDRLRVAAVVVLGALLWWAASLAATYLAVRPRDRSRGESAAGVLFVGVLVLAVTAPVALSARYATVQADVVTTVFEDNESATVPLDVTPTDPWGGRDRVSVLLLGGDSAEGREGLRTDTVILLTMDTGTGRTVMVSLPRNLMRPQFPVGTALHELYPSGFSLYGDPAFSMLNAVYGQVPELHPGVLGASADEGADAVKLAVAGSLGVPVDYYVLISFAGFRQLVDAVGGITVNVNEPVAIQGDTDRGIPPVGYLQPGPDQTLDGYHALWFARGRYGSDDYARMERQRCVVDALIDAAEPFTIIRRYEALAAAGKEVVQTDIPGRLLPAFVDLGFKVKEAPMRSVVFRSSAGFSPSAPDYDAMRRLVRRAIDPPRRAANRPDAEERRDDVATGPVAEDPDETCTYRPEE